MAHARVNVQLRVAQDESGRYRVLLEQWPEPLPASVTSFELDSSLVEAAVRAAQDLRDRRVLFTAAGALSLQAAKEVEALGERLQQLLLPNPLLKGFLELLCKAHHQPEAPAICMFLRLDETKLSALPWECLFISYEAMKQALAQVEAEVPSLDCRKFLKELGGPFFPFLQQRKPQVSLVRLARVPPHPSSPSAQEKRIRLLLAVANPLSEDLDPLDPHADQVLSALDAIQYRVERTVLHRANKDALRAALKGSQPYHTLVFYGHGRYRGPGRSELLLEGPGKKADALRSEELAQWLLRRSDNPTQLVMLIACEVGVEIAHHLVQAGIPVVVAMQGKIREADAQAFCEAFFKAAANGLPIDESLLKGREALSRWINREYVDCFEWALPVLVARGAEEAQLVLKDPWENRVLHAPPLTPENNPYRGLQPYEKAHSHLFFGREKLAKELEAFVQDHPLTVVWGPSGAGKSSLVMAGLLPRLPDETWQVFGPIRPGAFPPDGLYEALKSHAPFNALLAPGSFMEQADALAYSLREWSRAHPGKQALLVFDQFEELFTLCRSETERETLLGQLKRALDEHREWLRVVLSVRADFEGRFAEGALAAHWHRGKFQAIPPMTQDQLRAVIEAPADEMVLYFDPPELVDRLVNEVLQMPGGLPLLSFMLSELYRKSMENGRADRALTLADYESLGGVAEALRQRAQSEYDRLDYSQKETCKRVLLRMVSLEGGELARRKVFLSELAFEDSEENKRIDLILKRFTQARLLIQGEQEGKTFVEPAHDALIQSWSLLSEWAYVEGDRLEMLKRLAPAARDWARERKHSKKLLWKDDPRLPEGLKLLESGWLNATEARFIKLSERHRKGSARRLMSTTATVMLLLASAALFSFQQRNEAIESANIARQEKERAEEQRLVAEASTLAVQSQAVLGESDTSLVSSTLLAVESLKLRPTAVGNQALWNSLMWWPERVAEFEYPAPIIMLAFGPDEHTLVVGGADQSIGLWDLRTRSLIWRFPHNGKLLQVSIQAQDHLLRASWEDETLVWSLDDLREDSEQSPRHIILHPGLLGAVAYSEDGRLAITLKDGIAKVWANDDDRSLTEIRTLNHHPHPIEMIAMGRTGQRMATVSRYGEDARGSIIHFWSLESAEPTSSFIQDRRMFTKVAFSGDEAFLLVSSLDKVMFLLDAATGTLYDFFELEQRPYDLAFGRQNTVYVTASGNLSQVWLRGNPLAVGRNQVARMPHNGDVQTLAFSQNEALLATAVGNHIAVWKTAGDLREIAMEHADKGSITSMDYDLSSNRLLTAGEDGTARLWDSVTGRQLLCLRLSDVQAVALSPGGTRLVMGTGPIEKTVHVIDFKEPSPDSDCLSNFSDLEVYRKQELGAISALTFSPDGRYLAFADRGKNMMVLDLQAESGITEAHRSRYNEVVTAMAFSQDSRFLAVGTGEREGSVWIRRVNHWDDVHELPQGGGVRALAFSANGRFLAVSLANERSAKLLDTESGRVNGILPHDGVVRDAGFFSLEGVEYVATASQDGYARIFDADTKELLVSIPHTQDVSAVNFVRGERVATASGSLISIWRWRASAFIEAACHRLNRNFTAQEWQRFFPNQSYEKTCPNLPSDDALLPAVSTLSRTDDFSSPESCNQWRLTAPTSAITCGQGIGIAYEDLPNDDRASSTRASDSVPVYTSNFSFDVDQGFEARLEFVLLEAPHVPDQRSSFVFYALNQTAGNYMQLGFVVNSTSPSWQFTCGPSQNYIQWFASARIDGNSFSPVDFPSFRPSSCTLPARFNREYELKLVNTGNAIGYWVKDLVTGEALHLGSTPVPADLRAYRLFFNAHGDYMTKTQSMKLMVTKVTITTTQIQDDPATSP